MEEERQPKPGFRTEVKRLLGEHRGRKKKEEVKPWGKKERGLVVGALLATLILIALAWTQSKTTFTLSLPKLKLPEEKFVFEKEEVQTPVDVARVQETKTKFSSAVAAKSGTYGFYLFNLSTKQEYGVRENEIFPAASLIKLPVLLTLYQEAEAGSLSLETKYTLKESDKVGGSGSLYYKPAGTVVTYREMARLMGKQSDNTAFNIFQRILGDEKIQATIDEVGMQDTSLADNKTTPHDLGIFLRKLWGANIVSDKNRDEILEFLTETIYEEGWMPEGVPSGIRVAHKIGVEIRTISDAGIIFGQRPFVLVLMSKNVVETEARKLIPELTRIFWEAEGKIVY